jgi:predicted ATPase/class 3 adenylate cyclase
VWRSCDHVCVGVRVQPTGTVTFLFSDVEDHTRLWEEHPGAMSRSLERHDEIFRTVSDRWGGYVFSTSGDAFGVAFARVEAATGAAIEAQQALGSEPWPAGCELRVRMGMHTGEAEERDGDYFGPAVIRAARLMSLGHGSQVLVSGATARLLGERSDYASMLRPLGETPLRGLGRIEHVHELRYPGLVEEFPPLAVEMPRSGNLPSVPDGLIGRDGALADVAAVLAEAALVMLTGPGGVGKTRLSIEAGSRLGDRFADGVWFVPLASVTDEAAVPNAVAEVLGVQETAGRSLTESIVGAIAGRELLLILDNCEHVAGGARHLARAVVHAAAPVVVMATSREPLGITGERVVVVEPLSTDDFSPTEVAPAVELFIERARASDPLFTVDDATLDAVRGTCARLDGMPLAIELAAARVRGLGVDGLRYHLDDRFRLLRDRGAADPRHQTLRATVGWSYDLLDERLQELFCRASVFAGGFTLDAAEEVLAFGDLDVLDVADGLADLVDKSMVQTIDAHSGRRYRMLETMRQFGADTIDPTSLEASRDRFVRHYSTWCAAADRALVGPDAGRLMARLRAEFDNVREALRLATVADLLDDAARIAVSMFVFGRESMNAEPFVWALDLLDRVPSDHPQYADLLMSATWGCRARGDLDRARELIAVFEDLDTDGTVDPTPHSLQVWGSTYWFFQQTDRSIELLQRAISDAQATGDRWLESSGQSMLSIAQDSFDRAAAEQSARASLAVARSTSNPLAIGKALLALAGVIVHTEPERALDIINEMIDVAHDAGDLWIEATAVRVKAHALSRDGKLPAASRTYVEALDLNGVGDFGELLWYTVLNIVEHLSRIDDPTAAAIALGAFSAAPAAPSDDLSFSAMVRMRDRIAEQLGEDPAELEATGASMRLAELLNYLRDHLIGHAGT